MSALACCIDAAIAAPPGHAISAGDGSSLPSPAPFAGAPLLPQPPIITVANDDDSAVNPRWSPLLSSSLYKIDAWGAPYFTVNSTGDVTVRPHGPETLPHQEFCEGVGPTAVETTGRRRQTLWDQMSAIDTGSGNAAVLGAADKRHPQLAVTPTPAQVNRTLLDIIRDEEPHGGSLFGHSNKKNWKAFRERIRIRRAGSAWISSIHVPTSDIPIRNGNNRYPHQPSSSGGSSSGAAHRHRHHHHLMSKKNSVRFTTVSTLNTGETTHLDDLPDGCPPAPELSSSSASRPTMTRRNSTRFAVGGGSESDDQDAPPARSFRPQMSRHNSTRFPGAGQDPDGIVDSPRKLSVVLADERAMSAREAVAAQEAAEAEAAAQAAAEEEEDEGESPGGGGGDGPVRMSLMDLLEETDREMGLEGSRYTVGEDDAEAEEDEEEEDGADAVEHTCCVCMVRHKGSAFIPCGHTFCRLCSRELWVQRGNCPLCNGFILEVLDIF